MWLKSLRPPPLATVLPLGTGVLEFRPCLCSWRYCSFFSLRDFLSGFSERGERNCRGRDVLGSYGASVTSLSPGSPWGSSVGLARCGDRATVGWTGRLPRGQFWSISRVLELGLSLAVASASTALSIISLKLSSLRPRWFILTMTEGRRHSQKMRIIVPSASAQFVSNWVRIDWKNLRRAPLILHWFVQVLRVALYLAPDTIHKSFGVSEICSKEVFELRPGHRFGSIVLSFILEPCSKGFFAQKWGYEQNLVQLFCPSGIEVILALLAKPIAFYVQVFIVEIREPSFKRPLMRLYIHLFGCLGWSLGL